MLIRDTERRPEAERCRQNINIENELAIKRVYQTEPIALSAWAYMRAIRRIGSTKKLYAVNPYVEVYEMQEGVYGLLTESSDGMGDPWMYLVIGTEKAMLIDTGFGIGNLKGLCDEISGGKELVVVNTHGHPDHAFGNAQFDRVYCHEYEVESLEKQDEHLWDYLFENGDRKARPIWSDFNESDIISYKPYEIVGCPDGYTFDLGGGHEVELVHLGGHSAGSCGYLDKKMRCFFAGDDIINMRVGIMGGFGDAPHKEQCTVSAMCANLERLARRLDEFDHVCTGHFTTMLENTAVISMLNACRAIIADPVGNASFAGDSPDGKQYYRAVEELGTVCYKESSV